MIKLGSNSIGKIYLGSNSIGKAYLGSNLVFQKGSSPTPPTPVIEPVFYDRLVFDGTACIDTDIIVPTDASFRVWLGNETVKSAQRIFTVPTENNTMIGTLLNNNTTTTSRNIGVYYGASSAVATTSSAFSTNEYLFFLTPKRYGFSYTGYNITKGSNAPNGELVLGHSASRSGNPYSGNMGPMRIYGSDAQNAATAAELMNDYTPVYTLWPCTYDGEPGMWCVETSRFYGNTAGSGTLTVRNEE